MNDYILEIKNIYKSYPGVVALNDVSLSAVRGECLALVGENGAGKSTLIKMITGAEKPDKGSIVFEGVEYKELTPSLSMSLGIAAIYQELILCGSLSVAENIFLGQQLSQGFQYSKKETEAKAKEILRLFDVDQLDVSASARDLSVAHQQIVEIAKAIALNAKLIIMDEPTAPLTGNEIDNLFSIIQELKARGITIIYITHRLDELFEIADRAVVLRDGQVIDIHSIDEINKDQLISEMVGRDLKIESVERSDVSDQPILEVRELVGNSVGPISFKLNNGEILGFAGLVGAGRSELAELVFGASKIESGQILIDNEVVEINNPEDAINLGIGMVTEDRKRTGVLLRQTVKQNIVLPLLRKISKYGVVNQSEEQEIANHYTQELRIKTPSTNQIVNHLSGGNQQKVSVAKWLANESRILILDEPTKGIDVGAKQEIYNLIYELADEGKSIIVISSDMEELLTLTDRLIVLYEGNYMGGLTRSQYDQEAIMRMASGEKQE